MDGVFVMLSSFFFVFFRDSTRYGLCFTGGFLGDLCGASADERLSTLQLRAQSTTILVESKCTTKGKKLSPTNFTTTTTNERQINVK